MKSLISLKPPEMLQHSGTMVHGVFQINVVVPDSDTDQLTGLAGVMKIIIAPDGKHSYEFAHTVPDVH